MRGKSGAGGESETTGGSLKEYYEGSGRVGKKRGFDKKRKPPICPIKHPGAGKMGFATRGVGNERSPPPTWNRGEINNG